MAKTDIKTGTLERHGLTDEQLRALLRNMLLQRQLDNRGFQLNRQGKVKITAQQFPLDDAAEVLHELDAGRIEGRAVLLPRQAR